MFAVSDAERSALVHRPTVVTPGNLATLDEVLELVGRGFSDGRLPHHFERTMRATGVATRWFIRPAFEVFTQGSSPQQWPNTLENLGEIAVKAADGALQAADVAAQEIDALVVTSVSGYAMPGLDVQLIRDLGLRPDVRRLPVAQIGCAGGLFGLVRAREQVLAHPGARVLVVASEAFSSVMQPHANKLDALIYKALGGDGAAAAVVTDARHPAAGPAVELFDPFEYLVPDTTGEYRLTADPAGYLGFCSTTTAPLAILKAEPALSAWIGDRSVGTVVAHHGGPAILARTAQVLGIDLEELRHSSDSLCELGNVGSVSVLDILARTLGETAEPGEGTALSIGPGVSIIAARLRLHPASPEHA